jgi:hypothetical protein
MSIAEERAKQAKEKAIHLFQRYFKTVFKAAGLPWDRDNDTEIEAAVDLVIYSAILEALRGK